VDAKSCEAEAASSAFFCVFSGPWYALKPCWSRSNLHSKTASFFRSRRRTCRPSTTSRSTTPTRFEHLLLRPVPPSSRSYFESNPSSYCVSFYFVASEFCRGIIFWWITFLIFSCLLLHLIKTTSLLD
jgi:hypothetical protein